ncbi:hypothetical protein M422DRAFT_26167 [Sphaerobolus stellatus SS14]|nr:hypothetical protein M422DRAFT_26167 [Sphaerobolus stellatus SS14]
MPSLSRTASQDTTPNASATSFQNQSSASLLSSSSSPLKTRREAKAFYPLDVCSRGLRDIENWNVDVLLPVIKRPLYTSLELIPPAPVILDLACGYGHWCIRAAMFWKDARIVGVDMADIQPDLSQLGHDDLAERITWHHANILEPLQLEDNHFDVVRLRFSEFCVPENKWMQFLKEVRRVLKPNGLFEIAQQNCIFPCPKYPPRPPRPKNLPVPRHEDRKRYAGKYDISPELIDQDPRDHKRLKLAFEAMLEHRNLNQSIISTLPLYIEAHFEETATSPIIHFNMPVSSFVREPHEEATGMVAEGDSHMILDQRFSAADIISMNPKFATEEVFKDENNHMHITYVMHLILAAGEAIWEHFALQNPQFTRSDFDFLMKNWEMDMRDRGHLRAAIEKGLRWNCPVFGEEDPDQKAWKEMALKFHQEDGVFDARSVPESCRSIRLFRAFKRSDGPMFDENVKVEKK